MHGGVVTAVAFHPKTPALFTAAAEKVKLWDLDGKELWSVVAHANTVDALACSADGKWLATAGIDRTIKLWNLKERRVVHILQEHSDGVQSLAFSHDSRRLVSAAWD